MGTYVLGGFHQETNSFNPIVSDLPFFHNGIWEGEDVTSPEKDFLPIGGMFEVLKGAGMAIVPSACAFAQSGGKVDQAVVDLVLDKILAAIARTPAVDGVFLMLHGATQSTKYDDCIGYMLHRIRESVGHGPVVAISVDMHANITPLVLRNTDVICGYQTYPHLDLRETGIRAAQLGLIHAQTPLETVQVRVPMIVPASAYSTDDGPFAQFMTQAHEAARQQGIRDFSVFQMQPWLDVEGGASCVLAIDEDGEKAGRFAREWAQKLWDIRQQIQPQLYSIEQVVSLAKNNSSGKPCILVDSADSPNAGATGDNIEVVRRILDMQSDVRTAFALVDVPAADMAHVLGEGKTAMFALGGTCDAQRSPRIQLEATVKRLSDGVYYSGAPGMEGAVRMLGPSAVLQVGNIDILVCHTLLGTGDPQMYRGFGMEPMEYQLVVIKACTSFRASYSQMTSLIYQTDTPGAAGVHLQALPFSRIPRPIFPLDDIAGYLPENWTYTRK